jgi:hypothetical protein
MSKLALLCGITLYFFIDVVGCFRSQALSTIPARWTVFHMIANNGDPILIGDEMTTQTTSAVVEDLAEIMENVHTEAQLFSLHIKQMASQKVHLNNEEKRRLLTDGVTLMLDMEGETLASTIWSLGVLGCVVDDFNHSKSKLIENNTRKTKKRSSAKNKNKSKSDNMNNNAAATQPSLLLQSLNEHVGRASHRADFVNLCRVLVGISKMGYTWSSLPKLTRERVVDLLTNADKERLTDKDISIICYTLGQLKAVPQLHRNSEMSTNSFSINSKEGLASPTSDNVVDLYMESVDLPFDAVHGLLRAVYSNMPNMNNIGFVNSLHGLSNLSLKWRDFEMLLHGFQDRLCAVAETKLHQLHGNEVINYTEVCSLLQSLALMKTSWRELPLSMQLALIDGIRMHLKMMGNREVANVFWSLGKLDYPYGEYVQLNNDLCQALQSKVFTMKYFDMESVFVGLGLMQVKYKEIDMSLREDLLSQVDSLLDSMNIFCLYNVLWGLARMGAHVDILGPRLSKRLWNRTMEVMHAFLIPQYGDVVWSLATLGYSFQPRSNGNNDNNGAANVAKVSQMQEEKDKFRLLAILTRIYPRLHARPTAYVLWGLSKMDVHWDCDMMQSTRSLADGPVISPMAPTVIKYLSRINGFKEHEYAVLLFALGRLGANLSKKTLSESLFTKVYERAVKVAPYFSSRSLSNALDGLSKCHITWTDLSVETQEAYLNALQNNDDDCANIRNPSDSNNSKHPVSNSDVSISNYRKGAQDMNAVEITMTVNALATLGVSWTYLDTLQGTLTATIEKEWPYMSPDNKDRVKTALRTMGASPAIMDVMKVNDNE